MGLTKPIEQYLFSNLLTKIHIVVYLKDIIRGYVIYDEDKIIRLTEKGRSIAERVYEKHVYIEKLSSYK